MQARTSIAGAAVIGLAVGIIGAVAFMHRAMNGDSSIVGRWSGRPTQIEMQMVSDMNSSSQSLFGQFSSNSPAAPRMTPVEDDWRFEPNGTVIETSVESDSHGHTVKNDTVATYELDGDYLCISDHLSIIRQVSGDPQVMPITSEVNAIRFRVKGNTLTFLPTAVGAVDTSTSESDILDQVFHRL